MTATTARFAALRQDGRYRVVTTGAGAAAPGRVVATCASKAKAEAKAAKLNADLATDLAEAPAVIAEQVAAVEEAPADARSARATELADAVAAGQVSFDAAATELLGGAPAVRQGPAPEVVAKAVARFQAELDANAPALGKVMSEPLPGEAVPAEEAPATAQERPTMPEGAVVRHVIVTAAGRLPFASRSRAARAFDAAVAAGQPVTWESAKGRVLRAHTAD